jgi:hypothetical protein
MKETRAPRYNLDMPLGEKAVMNVDDLYIVLHHHWTKDITPYPDGRQIIKLANFIQQCGILGVLTLVSTTSPLNRYTDSCWIVPVIKDLQAWGLLRFGKMQSCIFLAKHLSPIGQRISVTRKLAKST